MDFIKNAFNFLSTFTQRVYNSVSDITNGLPEVFKPVGLLVKALLFLPAAYEDTRNKLFNYAFTLEKPDFFNFSVDVADKKFNLLDDFDTIRRTT